MIPDRFEDVVIFPSENTRWIWTSVLHHVHGRNEKI